MNMHENTLVCNREDNIGNQKSNILRSSIEAPPLTARCTRQPYNAQNKSSYVTHTPQHHRFAHCKGFLIFMCIILTHLSLFPLGNRFAKIAHVKYRKSKPFDSFSPHKRRHAPMSVLFLIDRPVFGSAR